MSRVTVASAIFAGIGARVAVPNFLQAGSNPYYPMDSFNLQVIWGDGTSQNGKSQNRKESKRKESERKESVRKESERNKS